MKRLALGLILASLSCFGCLLCSAQPPRRLPPSEIDTLRVIATKLNVSSEVWDFSLNPCDNSSKWVNVSMSNRTTSIVSNLTCGDCDNRTNVCHVVSIQLKSMNLTGVLPAEFANLTRLTVLDLTRSVLRGSIPAAWGTLPLVNLILLGNQISGVIPDQIGNIKTLEFLSLEDNLLIGSIPGSLGQLTNLKRLLLCCNNFTGELPESLGNLKNLTDFRIDGNGISGKIPSFIGNWRQLKRLDMQGTSLEGVLFPSTFTGLNLTNLMVSDFKGDGTFPQLLGMSLQILILRNCSISGQLPDYLGFLSTIDVLDLSFNNFFGQIPPSYRNLMQNKVLYLYLAHNKLNGTIPLWIFGNKFVDLSYNSFNGPKTARCNNFYVNLVSSFSSTLDNSIPTCLRKNLPCPEKATNYQLFINCGGGSLFVDGNEYEEDITSVDGTIYHSTPRWAYSSTGNFVGNLNQQSVLSNASMINTTNPLYLSARTTASSLKYYGFCLQKGSYTVKLHFAEITYTDDRTFSSIGRRFFDVFVQGEKVLEDFNIAEAAKGAGREIVQSFNTSVDSTLEIHLRWSGKGTNAIPDRGTYGPLISAISVTPNFLPAKARKKSFPIAAVSGIVIAACMVCILVGFISWTLLKKKGTGNEGLELLKLQGTYFSLRQIRIATKGFDPSNKIGEGGFGSVYKGILPDGTLVAVKQLSSKSTQGNREFVNEIGTLSALTHPNLVKLFGCCIEGDQLLLIYEYMENNSLAHALYGPDDTRLKLDWKTRRNITLQISRGLAYLHEESRLKIIHRDIKPTNVLLDKYFNAKISDFGLAKLDDEEKTHISTRIAGTVGYMAPEYAIRGHLTEKADIYSFGVVVVEIVSGKCNAKCGTKDFMYLLDQAYLLQEQGRLLELVDPSLGSDYSMTEAEQLLNLALACTNLSPALRPAMSSVVSMIEGEIPVPAPVSGPSHLAGAVMRFRASENFPPDTEGISVPWLDSSASGSNIGDTMTQSMTSHLLNR